MKNARFRAYLFLAITLIGLIALSLYLLSANTK